MNIKITVDENTTINDFVEYLTAIAANTDAELDYGEVRFVREDK